MEIHWQLKEDQSGATQSLTSKLLPNLTIWPQLHQIWYLIKTSVTIIDDNQEKTAHYLNSFSLSDLC